MDKKYELTDETIVIKDNTTLYRIRALKDFGYVKKGQLGGYVESEKNLSQEGNCWIADNAYVFDNAEVRDDALISNKAFIQDNANVFGNAFVHGNCRVFGNANVFGKARIRDNAKIYLYAKISGDASISGNAKISGEATISGSALVYDNAIVSGDATVDGKYELLKDALINSKEDLALVDSFGSVNRTSTFFRSKDGEVHVKCGCFFGTLGEFRKRVKERHGNNKYAKEYLMIADLMELRFSNVKGE